MPNVIRRITVKALFAKDGLVFIVKDVAHGTWELPGGKIDNDDSEEETLHRELKEELNIDSVEIGPQIDTFKFSVERFDKTYEFNVVVRKCHADLSNITLSDEHTEFKWVDPKEIEKYQMRDGYKQAILKLQKDIS